MMFSGRSCVTLAGIIVYAAFSFLSAVFACPASENFREVDFIDKMRGKS